MKMIDCKAKLGFLEVIWNNKSKDIKL